MLAPLMEAIPPPQYGGTERVVALLTDELVRRGHDVTLFASGDSRTAAHLVACAPRGLRMDPEIRDYLAFQSAQLGAVYRRADDFDVIHNHVDHFAFASASISSTPTLSTCHGRLDLPEVRHVYDAFRDLPLVAISEDQRGFLPDANWAATVYNAVDLDNYRFRAEPGDYLVFLGRISPEKRPDRAIELAREAGMRLVIAAKVDPADRDYFDHAIKPLIQTSDLIEFIGEVDEREKDRLLGEAYAYLFPIDWPEPFGLTMAESMATGTPVIGSRAGSVPEIVIDGVTGFVCDTLTEMAHAIPRVAELDRRASRDHVERHFTATVMADGYVRAYEAISGAWTPQSVAAWG
jgi:glycosyltransferase involved in cell wall biosynthesis